MPAPVKYRYVVSAPGGPYAFLPHPHLPGLWLRSHPSVLVAACALCKAAVGDPCVGGGGKVSGGTHYDRRHAARGQVEKLLHPPVTILAKGTPSKGGRPSQSRRATLASDEEKEI